MISPSAPYLDDTIAAVATAPGRSGKAIVRLSGARALEIAGNAASQDLSSSRPYTSRECRIAVDGVDVPCILYLMRAPRSYTKEDV
ncbi:tRNA uridine-5-carboxymethylaminomethyl(34) synthesis GTPase MnmE, partial [Planctomycetota bacterium]